MAGPSTGRQTRCHRQDLTMCWPREFSANRCAGATCFDTCSHISHFLAVIGARRAYLTAQPGELGIELTFASHCVSGECAKRCAIQHQTQMLGPGMFAPHLHAMGHRHCIAGGMAMLERLDRTIHMFTELVHERTLFRAVGAQISYGSQTDSGRQKMLRFMSNNASGAPEFLCVPGPNPLQVSFKPAHPSGGVLVP
jgi:hypothetical protein